MEVATMQHLASLNEKFEELLEMQEKLQDLQTLLMTASDWCSAQLADAEKKGALIRDWQDSFMASHLVGRVHKHQALMTAAKAYKDHVHTAWKGKAKGAVFPNKVATQMDKLFQKKVADNIAGACERCASNDYESLSVDEFKIRDGM
jgi:hypothetical protein